MSAALRQFLFQESVDQTAHSDGVKLRLGGLCVHLHAKVLNGPLRIGFRREFFNRSN
jgi:hypothetical protein